MPLTTSDYFSSCPKSPRHFTTTRWSLVTNAATGDDVASQQALEVLCQNYREPILTFIKSSGYQIHDAQDLTQQFFLYILTNNTLIHAQSKRGKFRTFLLSCLKNFLINQHKHRNRLKRGGSYQFIGYETNNPSSEPAECQQSSPEFCYDKRWAETVVENALTKLEQEWRRDNKPFDLLKGYLTHTDKSVSFAKRAKEIGVSKAALKSAVHRMRQRYGHLVKEEVTSTVSHPDDITDELRHLLNMLATS